MITWPLLAVVVASHRTLSAQGGVCACATTGAATKTRIGIQNTGNRGRRNKVKEDMDGFPPGRVDSLAVAGGARLRELGSVRVGYGTTVAQEHIETIPEVPASSMRYFSFHR